MFRIYKFRREQFKNSNSELAQGMRRKVRVCLRRELHEAWDHVSFVQDLGQIGYKKMIKKSPSCIIMFDALLYP